MKPNKIQNLFPLFQVHNHFPDFETDPVMMEYLEKFEAILEREKMNGQLRMLNFACAEKVYLIYAFRIQLIDLHDRYSDVRLYHFQS